jgi:acyl carrier protein
MQIEDFIKKLELEFDDLTSGFLKPGTSFKEIETWSSMHSLILIAHIHTEYNVLLSGEELRKFSTVKDLFDLVKTKMNANV